MRGTGWLLIAWIAVFGGSRIALGENISPSDETTGMGLRSRSLFHGALCAFAGRYDQTIAACDDVLHSDPKNVRPYALRGYAYLLKKHHARQAIAEFSEVLRSDPDNVAIHIARARAYLQDKNDDRAIADLSEAIRLDPRCSEAYSRRGVIYRVNKHVLGKALADYSTALRFDPRRPWTRAARADEYRRLGECARALADLEIIFHDDPGNEMAHFIRGLVYLDQHDNVKARADPDELISLYPHSHLGYGLQSQINLVSGEGGKCFFNTVAGMLLQPGRFKIQRQPATATDLGGLSIGSADAPPPSPSDDERIAACTKRLRDAPNVATYYERASAYYRKDDYKPALADLDEIIRRDPADAEAYHLRGRVHRSRNDNEDATNDFNNAIRLDPDNAEYYLDRGFAYAGQKMAAEALRDYAHCLRLDPRYALAHVIRGGLYCSQKRYDRAIADFSEALRLWPAHALAYAKRGSAFFLKGELDRAFSDWRQDLRLDPGDIQVCSYLAWCLATCSDAHLRNGKESLDLATTACEATKWRNWRHLSVLAAANAECGDFDRAVKWQTKSRELAPTTEKEGCRWYLDLYQSRKPYHESPPHSVSASPSTQ